MCILWIYINEDQVASQRKLFDASRTKVKEKSIDRVWTKFGNMYVQISNDDFMLIKSLNDLSK